MEIQQINQKFNPTEYQNNKNKKQYTFQLQSLQKRVYFTSHFDSGNLYTVQQITQFQYRITGYPDQIIQKAKYWIYFKVVGFPVGCQVKFNLFNINILRKFYILGQKESKSSMNKSLYQICYKQDNCEWRRISEYNKIQINNQLNQIELTFSHTFKNENVEFAFCFPYSYQMLHLFLENLKKEYNNDSQIEFTEETLVLTHQQRPVKILTINAKSNLNSLREQYPKELQFPSRLFPYRQNQKRPFKTQFKKNYILITGRVHPAESPSSFVVEGILKFILDKKDLRSLILRELFTIIVIPMLNPDGVYHGNFRFDQKGQNLNRYYHIQQNQNQNEIYAIKMLIQLLEKQNRLMYYFDLHAHNSPKGCFIYGNYIEQFHKHVQSKVYCKVLQLNEQSFQYQSCDFSLKNMFAKDKCDKYSKQGCGRVYVFKTTRICHSYTVQCGYYRYDPKPRIQQSNKNFNYGGYYLANKMIKKSECIFSIEKYRQIGQNLMITILDTLQLNPYSKIENSEFKNILFLRKRIAYETLNQEERFKRNQLNIHWRVKNIGVLIDDVYSQFRKRFFLSRFLQKSQNKWPSIIKFDYYITNIENKSNNQRVNSEGNANFTKRNLINNLINKNKKIYKPQDIIKEPKQYTLETSKQHHYPCTITQIKYQVSSPDSITLTKNSIKSETQNAIKLKKIGKLLMGLELRVSTNTKALKNKSKMESEKKIYHKKINTISQQIINNNYIYGREREKIKQNRNTVQQINKVDKSYARQLITLSPIRNSKAQLNTQSPYIKFPKLKGLKIYKIKIPTVSLFEKNKQ